MASYSTDILFFADVARFIKLTIELLPEDKRVMAAKLLLSAIAMTENGVFTDRRASLSLDLLSNALRGQELTPDFIDNFLVEKNARNKSKEIT